MSHSSRRRRRMRLAGPRVLSYARRLNHADRKALADLAPPRTTEKARAIVEQLTTVSLTTEEK